MSARYRLFLVVFILILLVNISAFSFTKTSLNSEQKVRISVEKLDVRFNPSSDAPVIKTISKGTILEPIQKVGEWHQIELFDKESGFNLTGYVHQSGVILVVDEASENRFVVKISKANVHLEPSEESIIISTIPIGVNLNSSEKIQEWYKIILPSVKGGIVIHGYIHQDSVEVFEEIKEQPEVQKKNDEKTQQKKQDKIISVEREHKKFNLGIKTGLNRARLLGPEIEDYIVDPKPITRLNIGVFANYHINEYFIIQPEISFTSKGGKRYLSSREDQTWYFNYIEIPILLKQSFKINERTRTGIFLGPYLAFALSGKYKSEIIDQNNGAITTIEGDIPELKPFDFGFILGGGVDFSLASIGRLGIDVYYSIGFPTLHDEVDPDYLMIIRNRTISFVLRYYFNLFN